MVYSRLPGDVQAGVLVAGQQITGDRMLFTMSSAVEALP